MASMYESAEKINKDIKDLFGSVNINEFTKPQREAILNIIIRFGSVAKFRCRSNTAYDNFVTTCFKDVAKLDRVKINPEDDYEILRATIEDSKIVSEFKKTILLNLNISLSYYKDIITTLLTAGNITKYDFDVLLDFIKINCTE